jgi:hypothetical protein
LLISALENLFVANIDLWMDIKYGWLSPSAIVRHERLGHNWNDGILELWNDDLKEFYQFKKNYLL